MERLSNELISGILDQIAADPEKIINIDKRAYLSVESFRAPEPLIPDQAQDVASFRRVCKRFGELGIRHQFTRISTRFSKKGFERLENIAGQPHLAKHVKKFSYMIPFFYVEGRENIDGLFSAFRHELSSVDLEQCKAKAADQRDITRERLDVRSLHRAMAAFTSLLHVQILRLQDEADRNLIDCIRNNHDTAPALVDLKWTPACVHATKTVGDALVSSGSPFSRFSGPMMSPQSVIALAPNPNTSSTSFASQLTCLELHFDDGLNLDSRIRDLAPLFKTVFEAATNMLAVHLGFPSRAPLSLRLEEVFHGVKWRNLRAFGIQAWKLDASEIIDLALRHRKTLRGLRLRDVHLTEGSRWKDVLASLREGMDELNWVSLRRIGYASYFEENIANTIEVPDWVGSDESDVEDRFSDQLSTSELTENGSHNDHYDGNDDANDGIDGGNPHDNDVNDDNDDDDNASDSDRESEDEHGPQGNELAIIAANAGPDTPSSAPFCVCGSKGREWNSYGKEDLGDEGQYVSADQRKRWEQWVVGRCAEHGRN